MSRFNVLELQLFYKELKDDSKENLKKFLAKLFNNKIHYTEAEKTKLVDGINARSSKIKKRIGDKALKGIVEDIANPKTKKNNREDDISNKYGKKIKAVILQGCKDKGHTDIDFKIVMELLLGTLPQKEVTFHRDDAPQTDCVLEAKIDAFKIIYQALYDGQRLKGKSFLLEKEAITADDFHREITAHSKNKNNRTAKAWELAELHYKKCNLENKELYVAIHSYAFENSGWGFFKKTNFLGMTLFSSWTFSKEVGKLSDDKIAKAIKQTEKEPTTRSAKICNSFLKGSEKKITAESSQQFDSRKLK